MSLKSHTTLKLLVFFFSHEDENLYLNEISRRLNLEKRNLAKKLNELEQEGLFISERRGNLKLYSLNKKFSLYKEYKKIVLKTFGIEQKLKEVLQDIKGISKAYIFGSYASGKMDASSDVDLLVVGDHSSIELQKQIAKLQKDFDREINVINIGSKEYARKRKDPFIEDIKKKDKIILI